MDNICGKQFILVILIRSSDGISNKNVEMDTECSKNRGKSHRHTYIENSTGNRTHIHDKHNGVTYSHTICIIQLATC